MQLQHATDPCPLCLRPNLRPSDHHLVPKSRGGRVTLAICNDCHKAIHAIFSNKELAATYHTVEALLAHETMARMVAFIARQDPSRRVRMAPTRARARRLPSGRAPSPGSHPDGGAWARRSSGRWSVRHGEVTWDPRLPASGS